MRQLIICPVPRLLRCYTDQFPVNLYSFHKSSLPDLFISEPVQSDKVGVALEIT